MENDWEVSALYSFETYLIKWMLVQPVDFQGMGHWASGIIFVTHPENRTNESSCVACATPEIVPLGSSVLSSYKGRKHLKGRRQTFQRQPKHRKHRMPTRTYGSHVHVVYVSPDYCSALHSCQHILKAVQRAEETHKKT